MKSASLPSSDAVAAGPVARPALLLRASRKVSVVHRWLGTLLCAFFALWFATGFVMIYVPFPSLGDAARIAGSGRIDWAAVKVTPGQALEAASAPAPVSLRLVALLGEPRYVIASQDGPLRAISATGPAPLQPVASTSARAIGERFGRAPAAGVAGPFDYDQWVVHQHFDSARPFYRVDLADAAGTQLYVSSRSGEVLQRTSRFERGWNWVGAVVHWIYPTVLRQSFRAWDQTVWWLSLVGIATALAGIWLGVVRTVNLRRKRQAGVSPFRGWLHWHHVLGLFAGGLVLTWIFSGWLSMDHGRLFSLEVPDVRLPDRLRGMSLDSAVAGITLDRLRALEAARELEFTAVAGEPLMILRGLDRGVASIAMPADPANPMAPTPLLPDSLLLAAVRAAWAPVPVASIAAIADDDAYGHLRSNPLPDTARRVTLADAGQTWVHVDAASGHLIAVMDRSRRIYRWLFEGLHTFDFPWLNNAGPLWQVLMLIGLVAGLAFSMTAVVLGLRRLKRSV